jgi:hypothetical protein
MQKHRWYARAGLTALFVCALVAAGCGGGNDTTTTTSAQQRNAQQRVDAAIKSCNDQAHQLGGIAGTGLASACTYVGTGAKHALASGSENVKQGLSKFANGCRSAVGQLPKGQAQDAFSKFCDAIASAG